MESYKTIGCAATAEYVEKRSRFIASVYPVTAESEAVSLISKAKQQYWDARHNVYAYRIRSGNLARYSDDGEPQGTAGVPMLDILIKEEIFDCVGIVTRYFGGVLLGTGGLVRAYSHSLKSAVEKAGIVTVRQCCKCTLSCDYQSYSKIQSLLINGGAKLSEPQFSENICLSFTIPEDAADILQKALCDATSGKYKFQIKEKIFCKL